MSKRKKKYKQTKSSAQNSPRTKEQINTNIKSEQKKSKLLEVLDASFGKYAVVILFLTMILIGSIAFGDFMNLKRTYIFKDIGSDVINGTYPAWVQYSNLLKEGIITKWSFYEGMGQNWFSGFPLDPRSLISQFLTVLLGEDFLVYGNFHFFFAFGVVITGLLTFVYFRTVGFNKNSSFFGALTVAFVGYSILGSAWAHGFKFLYGIFYLFSFEQLFVKKRWYFFPFAVAFMSGNPFFLYAYTLFLLLYFIVRFYEIEGVKVKEFFILSAKMLGLGILGIAMNAVNLVSSYMKIFQSPRVGGNVSNTTGGNVENVFNIDNYSEFQTTILRFFSNDILGNGSNFKGWYNYLEAPIFYAGLLTLFLFIQAFVHIKGKKKYVHAAFVFFMTLIAFVPEMRHAVQFYVGNYYKGVVDFYVPFTVIFYATYSLHLIIENKKINIPLLVGSLVLFLIALHLDYPRNPNFPPRDNPIDKSISFVVTAFLITYSLCLAFIGNKKYGGYIFYLLLLVFGIELTYASKITTSKRKTYGYREFKVTQGGYKDGTAEAVKYIQSIDSNFFRIDKEYRSGTGMHGSLNDAQAQGFYGTACYSSFNQANYIRFLEETRVIKKGVETATRWAPGLYGRPLLQTIGNVKYILGRSGKTSYSKHGYADSIASVKGIVVQRSKQYLPLGFTYDRYMKLKDFKKLKPEKIDQTLMQACILDSITNLEEVEISGFNLTDTAGTYTFANYQRDVKLLGRDTLTISHFSNSKIEGDISLTENKILFFSIPFDIGWGVKVNGAEKKLFRANLGFTGIVLPKGSHKLVLEFNPPFYFVSLIISGGALVAFVLLVFFFKKK